LVSQWWSTATTTASWCFDRAAAAASIDVIAGLLAWRRRKFILSFYFCHFIFVIYFCHFMFVIYFCHFIFVVTTTASLPSLSSHSLLQ